jgi:predicted nucleic acid-binding protein
VSSFVLDASVTLAWCFEGQSSDYTEAVLQAVIEGNQAVVPAIWKLEVANALTVAERRKMIAPEKLAPFLHDLERLQITVDPEGMNFVFGDVLDLARRCQRSAYDASYLELASRKGLPLATRDEPLRAAARGMGIPVYQF